MLHHRIPHPACSFPGLKKPPSCVTPGYPTAALPYLRRSWPAPGKSPCWVFPGLAKQTGPVPWQPPLCQQPGTTSSRSIRFRARQGPGWRQLPGGRRRAVPPNGLFLQKPRYRQKLVWKHRTMPSAHSLLKSSFFCPHVAPSKGGTSDVSGAGGFGCTVVTFRKTVF